ncbi:disulfide bond formation protein DsbA [Streptomyces albus subsp. chlorinus]|uniref:DsbA family protein n=1 Tax=Streptomyces albus TaxID=1888 RepID=UPI00156FC7C1|nr:DsbA family protein [Streptomyces albus]NSC20089.1 disulfide bond formation protein DsbA [Streptomyces albus subsp. chlorinus]
MTDVDLWFDPSCPYTWITSRWLREVTRVRDVTVRWRVMSLAVLNEHREVDPEGDPGGYLRLPVRVCAAVTEEHGPDALGAFYDAFGERVHERGDWDWERVLPAALSAARLPARLAEAAASTAYDAAVRASHGEAVGLVGDDVGTPVLGVRHGGGPPAAVFGPCVSPAPRGEAAGRLWDGVLALAGTPQFYGLRRAPAPLPG